MVVILINDRLAHDEIDFNWLLIDKLFPQQVEQTTFHPFCENEILVDALTKGNPFLKAELFSWLASHLPNAKKVSRACPCRV